MTGRDLIMYILQNGLEDEPLYKDGRVLGFMSVYEAAAKAGVGPATIELWATLKKIDSVKIGSAIYIPINVEFPTNKEVSNV